MMLKSIFITDIVRGEHSRIALYNAVYMKLQSIGVEWSIYEYGTSKVKNEPELKSEIITCQGLPTKLARLLFLLFVLIKKRPGHLLIGGYGILECWLAIVYCKVMNKRRTYYGGSSFVTAGRSGALANKIKRAFLGSFDSYVCYGSKTKEYVEKIGVKNNNNIFVGINVSDTDFYRKKFVEQIDVSDKKNNGRKQTHFVFSARVVQHKGIFELLECIKNYDKSDYLLTIIGTGIQIEKVKEIVADQHINADCIGRVDRNKLAEKMIDADVYVNPSLNDPFSRTVSEALTCGAFCISSIYDDATFDLINQENGIIFDPLDSKQFRKVLDYAIGLKWDLKRKNMIHESMRYDTEHYATQIFNAIDLSVRKSER